MLILIGTVPTAYALNHAVRPNEIQTFVAVSDRAHTILEKYVTGTPGNSKQQGYKELETAIANKTFDASAVGELSALVDQIKGEVSGYNNLASIPAPNNRNVRNDMYLASESIRVMTKVKQPKFASADEAAITNYRKQLDGATKFIPDWVKVAVALALGLGTMVGWKRIVVTVGERIGKQHLTYAQGASAELIAMITIRAADVYGLPVSTTHVLTSGVAGTMAANGSGLQWATVRSLMVAWVLTLPASIVLAGALYWVFRHTF